jgi:feruloyl esterase
LTKQFYGTAHKKAYYLGCSTGGRQGFKSVQSYPLDFDGVLAGAPALNYPNLNSWSNHFYPIFGDPGNATYVPIPLWAAVHREIVSQCDGIDGVVDGIIEDPELRRFRPEALQCAPGVTNSSICLTSAQVGAVRDAFTDLYGVNRKLIYPRMQPGSEVITSLVYYANGAFSFSSDWFKYVVYSWFSFLFTYEKPAQIGR